MWPELTVDANLYYIGRLKGMSNEDIEQKMMELKKLLSLS